MLTRRALLKSAALTAGTLIRVEDGAFEVVAQAVSAATVRVLFLPRRPGSPRHSAWTDAAARVANDGALTRQQWPPLSIGRQPLRVEPPISRWKSRAISASACYRARGSSSSCEPTRRLARCRFCSVAVPFSAWVKVARSSTARALSTRCAAARMVTGCVRTAGGCRSNGSSQQTAGGSTSISHWAAFDFSRSEGQFVASPLLPLDVFIVASNDPATIVREYARHHRARRAPAALDVWLHAIASHAGRPRGGAWRRAHVSGEEAAVRRADLPRHRVHAVGMEHAQRRVHLARGQFSRPEGDRSTRCTPCTTRSCCTRSSRATISPAL